MSIKVIKTFDERNQFMTHSVDNKSKLQSVIKVQTLNQAR